MSSPIQPPEPLPRTPANAPAMPVVRGMAVAPEGQLLTIGETIGARVIGQDAGQLLLHTQAGTLAVRTAASLPHGTAVQIHVLSGGEQARVVIVPLPTGQAGGGTVPASRGAPLTTAATPTVSTALTEGSVITATVSRLLAATGSTAPAIAAPPGTASPPAAASGPAHLATSALPASTVMHPPEGLSLNRIEPGQTLVLRILGTAPPEAPVQAPPANPNAPILMATVTAAMPGGIVLAQTATAEITFLSTAPLPPGSKLVLELLGLRDPLPAGSTRPIALSEVWETLRDALAVLRAEPGQANAMPAMLPRLGPQLAPGVIFFISALLSGDLRRFLGEDALRALGRQAPQSLDRLAGEFAQMQRLGTEPAGQDWRLFLIPLLTEEGLQQLRFYVRPRNDDGGNKKEDRGIRFVVEVNLSRLGPFQFDGLARKQRIDLLVRTHRALPAAMQDDVRRIYSDTTSALGFGGGIAFHATPTFDTHPMQAAAEADGHRDLTV